MDAAWPGVVVEESNLAVQISAIRLRTLLSHKLARDELERLRVEGAGMSEEEACRMALEE